MRDHSLDSAFMEAHPKYLWFITLTYTIIIVLANWFDPRLIHIFNLDTDAGTLIFPFTFLLSDLITEIYGYKHARRAIWCGFLFNIIFIIYSQIVIHLPSPNYETNNAMFDTILAANIRIIMASCVSYLASEPLNSFIMAKLKIKLSGGYLGIRFVLSTLVASGVDSIIFGFIAFYGVIANNNLIELILSMWFIKVLIEIFGLPISIRITKKLKSVERLDIYDKQTNFSLLSLETSYGVSDNEYK